MKSFITILILLTSLKGFAQFDYDLYMYLTTAENLNQHKKISKIIEYETQSDRIRKKTSVHHFLKNGYPSLITQFDWKEEITGKTEFIYDTLGLIKSIETYKYGKHSNSTEFEVNALGQIIHYTDYVYSSYDQQKLLVFHTHIEYNPNLTIKKFVKQNDYKHDTIDMVFYNNFGVKTKRIFKQGKGAADITLYAYSEDSTEMIEKHYRGDTTLLNQIIHRYKDKKEVERIDSSISKTPFYWKYDQWGRLVETNEYYFSEAFFMYNSDGFLISKSLEVMFPDADCYGPTKVKYEYDYEQ